MKNTIKGIIIGIVITSVVGVSASYVYTARDIGYTPSDSEWNVSNASEALSSLKTDITNMQNLANQGNMLYDAGTNIVGLVSDNSPYVDSNGNYILASSTLGQSMIDNVTYKSIESPSSISGSVGSETVTVVSGSKLKRVVVGTLNGEWTNGTKSIDCTSIPNYQDLTVDNFTYEITSMTGGGYTSSDWLYRSVSPTKSYNPSTGIFTLSGMTVNSSSANYGVVGSKATVICYYLEN